MAKVLVVDDTLAMRLKLKEILIESGHTVIGEADNGKRAIIMATKLKPDLITMDITMPIMNGVDALRHLIQLMPSVKVIMITAMSQKPKVLEALEIGAKHYIVKPFDKRLVQNVIEKVLHEEDFPGAHQDEKIATVGGRIKHKKSLVSNPSAQEVQKFIVQNREGTFVILPAHQNGHWISVVIDRIIHMKSLHVVINLLAMDTLSVFLFKQIVLSVERIKRVGGRVEIYANEDLFAAFDGKAGYNMVIKEVNKYFE